MSIAQDEIHDDGSVSGGSDSGATERDISDRLEFLTELYLTVGIAGSIFLVIMQPLIAFSPSTNSISTTLIPVIVFANCSFFVVLHSILLRDGASVEKVQHALYSAVIISLLFISVFIVGTLDHYFVSLIPESAASVDGIRQEYVSVVLAISIPSGYLLGLYENRGTLFAFATSFATSVFFGGLAYFVLFVL